MCHPAVTIALMAASTAAQMVAQRQQTKAQNAAAQQAADYNSKVAANEAQTRQQLAQAEMQKTAEERNRVLRAGLNAQGTMANTMGAGGFTLDQGTNLSLLAQSSEEVAQDMSIVQQQGNMAAWQHLAGATAAGNEGAFGQWNARATKAANSAGSKMALAGTILGAAAQGVGMYGSWAGSGTPAGGITQIELRHPGGTPVSKYARY